MLWWKPILVLLAAINVVWGLFAIAQPERAAELIGLVPLTRGARGEIRAVYGGLLIVLGYLVFLAPRQRDGGAWLRVAGLAFLGLAAGRLAGLALDGWAVYTAVALAFEAATGAFLLHVGSKLDSGRKA